jgi:chromosomal replication initiation ATPase DnaA
MIADQAPPEWQPGLADLRTRLAITPVTAIGLPDDRLFTDLIALHFADRGLHVPADALRFMAGRIERDYWAAERAVEAVDRFAIAERARISVPTMKRALAEAGLLGDADL